MEAGQETFKLVIEGAGDIVQRGYLPAIEKLKGKGRRLEVVFADDSSYWRKNAGLRGKMLSIKSSILKAGARYLDKADRAHQAEYEALQPDAVVVASPDRTHADVTKSWLDRPRGPKRIFIEKPLEANLDAARRLLGRIPAYDRRVLAFDHYRARLLPARAHFDMLYGFLNRKLNRFTFYFLEDHSGADPTYEPEKQRQGPIENEQRVQALQEGIILDVMPHVIAIVAHFGQVETLRVTGVRAAKYKGVDRDDSKLAQIPNETFAQVQFVFADYDGNRVEGEAFVGKGVRGVRELNIEHDRNAKYLILRTAEGRKVTFDLRSKGEGASKAELTDENGASSVTFDLNPDPYYTFLAAVTDPKAFDERIGLYVELGKRILEIIEDMRFPIKERLKAGGLDTYPCGIGGKRESLYLDEITQNLRWIYGQAAPD